MSNSKLPPASLFINHLVSNVLTRWEISGNTIGVDKHMQIRRLLQALPTETSLEQLKTLLAPLLVETRQEQFEFYGLFDKILLEQTAAQRQHAQRVAAELDAAKRDARRKWWLALVRRSKAQTKRAEIFVQTRPRLALALSIGLLLSLLGIAFYSYVNRKPSPAVVREFLIYSDDENLQSQQACRPRGPIPIAALRGIQAARHHEVNFSWQGSDFCIEYVRFEPGVDTLICAMTTEDKQTHLFRFIFQSPPPLPPAPSGTPLTMHNYRVGFATQPKPGQPADPSFPNLSPVDNAEMLFDTANLVQKPSEYASELSSAWNIGLGYAYLNTWKAIIIGLFWGILLLIGYWRKRKKQTFALRHFPEAKPPYTWTLRIPRVAEIDLGEPFYRAATEMRKRQEGTFQRLDMKSTVRATVAQGGMVQFRYQKAPLSKDFLILLDMHSPHDHQARLFETVCQLWKDHEVPLELFYYKGDPRLCWNPSHPRGLSVQELYQKFPEHRLILWGTCHDMIGLSSGELQPWASPFDRWRRRAILSPRAPGDWDLREDALAQSYRLLPADPMGISALMETLEAVEAKSHLLWKTAGTEVLTPWLPKAQGPLFIQWLESELLLVRHGATDDRLLQWLAACALPPVLFWDWTLFVGEKLSLPNENFLHTDHLFQLLRLPWFADGKMPADVQSHLLDWLEEKHPAFLEQMRREWDKVLNLESNLPPVGSIAWEGHRVSVVLNQLNLKPKQVERQALEKELETMMASGIHDHAFLLEYKKPEEKRLGNTLSSRFRKYVQVKNGPEWVWRDWVWQLPLGLCFALLTAFVHHTQSVRSYHIGTNIKSLALSNDHQYLLIGSGDRRVSLWSVNGDWVRGFEGYRDEIAQVDFGRDNQSVLTGTADNFISFWDIWGQVQLSRQGPSQLVSAIAFDTDKKYAVLGFYETGKGVIGILDVAQNKVTKTFIAHSESITDIAISPMGDEILTASRDSLVKLWDLKGHLLQTFKGHQGIVYAVDFSPNAANVFSASRDNTARMWDRNGSVTRVFRGHKNDVYDVQCAPDNSSLLTASADHTARIWSLDGKTLRVLDGHHESVRIARYSADGQLMVTGSSDGTVKIWRK